MHYHSKNLVKYPEEGGVWNWHQVRLPSPPCQLFRKLS